MFENFTNWSSMSMIALPVDCACDVVVLGEIVVGVVIFVVCAVIVGVTILIVDIVVVVDVIVVVGGEVVVFDVVVRWVGVPLVIVLPFTGSSTTRVKKTCFRGLLRSQLFDIIRPAVCITDGIFNYVDFILTLCNLISLIYV